MSRVKLSSHVRGGVNGLPNARPQGRMILECVIDLRNWKQACISITTENKAHNRSAGKGLLLTAAVR